MIDSKMTRLISLILIVSCILGIVNARTPLLITCDALTKCSSDPPFAWATDGRNCWLFQNTCQLRNYNCQRTRNEQQNLIAVEEDDCYNYCGVIGCTRELDPVCTIQNSTARTFPSPCVWSQELCQSGDAYVFQFKGNCEPEA